MKRLLDRLPPKPHSLFACLAIATVFVAIGFLALIGVRQNQGALGFFILLPPIFLASVLLNRNAGLYATALSSVLLYVLLTPEGQVLLPRSYVLPLVLFIIVAVGFAIISDGLRTAWERAAAAEQAKDLLLQELGHRTKNNLMMVTSILSMQAQMKSNPEIRAALNKAINRIHAIASAHEHFRPLDRHGRIEMRDYLEELCGHLGAMLRDIRPIAVRVDAAQVYLTAEQAVPLGLIVNELVTNALKHAFPGDRSGTIDVILRREPLFTLIVRDNGVGCAPAHAQGIGSRLTRMLAQQLGAKIEWEACETGCHVRVVFDSQ